MNIRRFFVAVALAVSLSAAAIATHPTDIDLVVDNTALSVVSHDETTGVWTLRVEANDGGALIPTVRLKAITAAVDKECRALSFDYRTTQPCSQIQMLAYKVFMGSATQAFDLGKSLTVADDFRTFRYYVGALRDANNCRFLNKAGQYQELRFVDIPAGAVLELCNFRYDADETPFRTVEVRADAPALIEAEDFNSSASGLVGHNSRQLPAPPVIKYKNPTGNQFPILAWCSVDYDESLGTEFFAQQLKELTECGFNFTLGSGYGGLDLNLLYDDREFNGAPYAPCKDLDLWILVKTGLDDWRCEMTTNNSRWSYRLGGFFIKDEPLYDAIPVMASKAQIIKRVDPDHIRYSNLFSCEAIGRLGIKFEDYIERFNREVGLDVLSYDIYPVRQVEATGEIILIPEFVENLEIISKLARYYGQPFWAFVHSVESNCAVDGLRYPTPTEEHMRVQAFGNLAYGAQGIQYFTYKCPYDPSYNYTASPIGLDNQRTPTWYMVQNINREIKALTWVFLGAEMLRAGYTNAVTPQGAVRLTPEMLPAGVKSIDADGEGVCATVLQNGSNLFQMVVNFDLHNSQTVTVVTDRDVKRVLPDGTTENFAAGTHEVVLPTGGYLILLVSENETPIVRNGYPADERSTYRNDAENVIVTASDAASGGLYLPYMGETRWDGFPLPHAAEGHVITREQALDYWGSSFNYTIDVPEAFDTDIYIGHSVPAAEYAKVTADGLRPGYEYVIQDDASLNWPKEYAATMTLSLDGATIPAASGSDLLRFEPTADGAFVYNDRADYAEVSLPAGLHTLTLTSLCYPWHFDNIRIVEHERGAVQNVLADHTRLAARGLQGAVEVTSDTPFAVYALSGVLVAAAQGPATVALVPGLYIVASADGQTVKVIVK